MSDLQRLSKLMSNRGMCSRREADILIEQGLVKVDGEAVNTLGIKFPASVTIELTSKGQEQQNQRITIMLNKPVGHVSSQAEDDYTPAIRLFSKENRSELCRSSRQFHPDQWQGLLILTQDGRMANEIINPNTKFEKEYLVRFTGNVNEKVLDKLRSGLSLDDKILKPAKVRELNEDQLQFILIEGKKRQIRRMCDAVGLKVTGLKRVRVGELRLGKLAEGEWRYVEAEEFRHGSNSKEGEKAKEPIVRKTSQEIKSKVKTPKTAKSSKEVAPTTSQETKIEKATEVNGANTKGNTKKFNPWDKSLKKIKGSE